MLVTVFGSVIRDAPAGHGIEAAHQTLVHGMTAAFTVSAVIAAFTFGHPDVSPRPADA